MGRENGPLIKRHIFIRYELIIRKQHRMFTCNRTILYNINAVATDPENDILKYRWELLPEPTKVGEGGDHEDRPQPVLQILLLDKGKGNGTLKAPSTSGAYRLFVYVTDGYNNVATANLPCYVK